MIILGVILGALAGAVVTGIDGRAHILGVAFGAVAGYLIAALAVLNRRVQALERQRVAQAPAPQTAPPPVAVAPAVADRPIAPAAPAPQAPAVPVAAPARTQTIPAAPAWLWHFLTGGNAIVRIGVVVLFFGVAFLFKYAAEHSLLPIELRLTGAALGALVLLGLGWRLRARRAGYALALQGGAIGIWYLTAFAALRLYQLLPATFAFALLFAVAILSAALAVLQNARALAVLGVAGGFLAPILTSTGGGSHVALFSYYALLNLGILAIAWFRAWRVLNLLGFAFTFVIGALWGYQYYRPEFFAGVEPFLVLSFLFYFAIAVLFALRQPPQLRGYVDGTLVFGTPLVAFALQYGLVKDFEYGLAFSALALGLFYLATAWVLWRRLPAGGRALTEAFLALGVAFGTLAIPLAVEARWTAAAWALEGAAMVWVGVRQQRLRARLFGILLQLGAGIAFFADTHVHATAALPVLNSVCLGGLLIAFAGLFTSCYLYRHCDRLHKSAREVDILLLLWGLGWWFGTGINEIDDQVASEYLLAATVGLVAFSLLAFEIVGRYLAWPALRAGAAFLLSALALIAAFSPVLVAHPFAHGGFIGWPLALLGYYWVLYRQDTGALDGARRFAHAGVLWLLTLLLTWEVAWAVNDWVGASRTWYELCWGLVPASMLALLLALARGARWPAGRYRDAYLGFIAVPVAAALGLWSLFAGFRAGDPSPLPYLPVLNPLDLAQVFVLLALARWYGVRRNLGLAPATPIEPGMWIGVYAALVFLWLNAVLVRTLHHWGDVPLSFTALHHSVLAQSAFSIFWSVIALVVMPVATRLRQRGLWLAGAALLGAVVVKLFLVDLSGTGTVARIVSFLGVGVLLLVVGYLSPLPPRAEPETARS